MHLGITAVIFFLAIGVVAYGSHPFTSWTLSSASLPIADRSLYCVYEEEFNGECIWVFGGNVCGTCVYCYNITSDSIYTYDTLTLDSDNLGSGAAVLIDGIVYYWTRGNIRQYDIAAKSATTLLANVGGTTSDRCCLVRNPNTDNYNQLLIVNGRSSTAFYIYDIGTNSYATGNSLSVSRYAPECAVSYSKYNDARYDVNEAYLYVIGGRTQIIERIDVTGDVLSSSWETAFTMSDTVSGATFDFTSPDNDYWSAISYYNIIYMWGGWGASDFSDADETFYFDTTQTTSDMELEYCAGCDYPVAAIQQCAVLVESELRQEVRVYGFGGWNSASGGGAQTQISFSNNGYDYRYSHRSSDPPSEQPTDQPTEQPSGIPTQIPSQSPSNEPTTLPSTLPTSNPSSYPTMSPSEKRGCSNDTICSSTSVDGSATIVVDEGTKFEIDCYNMVGCEYFTILCLGECTILCDESVGVYCPKVSSLPGSCPSEDNNGNIVFIGCDGLENSVSPTAAPVLAPTDGPVSSPSSCDVPVEKCATSNCRGVDENPHCTNQQDYGCAQCENGYWFLSFDYPCVNCNIIENCSSCQSWNGCAVCEFGYSLTWDDNCGLNICK